MSTTRRHENGKQLGHVGRGLGISQGGRPKYHERERNVLEIITNYARSPYRGSPHLTVVVFFRPVRLLVRQSTQTPKGRVFGRPVAGKSGGKGRIEVGRQHLGRENARAQHERPKDGLGERQSDSVVAVDGHGVSIGFYKSCARQAADAKPT